MRRNIYNFQIRECDIDDAKFIYELNYNEMGYEFPVKETEKKLECLLNSGKDKILVATVDDFVVGYIHANDYDVIYAYNLYMLSCYIILIM